MLIAVTAMLVSAVELSTVFSVFIVLICLFAVVLLVMRNVVFRFPGDDMMFGASPLHITKPPIPQMKMMKVHIPFTFKLQESSRSSCCELQCTVSSQVPYTLQAFWGVPIRELHLFLWRPWRAIQEQVAAGCLLEGHFQRHGVVVKKLPHGEELLTMSLPQPCLDLGTPPRLRYPLVIFIVRDDQHSVHPDETVSLINVVHIKDSVCTLPTSILAQYLKQANGQLSCLKQLYLATVSLEEEPVVCAQGDDQLCVVCQYFPVSRALLPCRHTCVCASCFGKMDRCPMCRGPIRSYFCIRGEEYMPAPPAATSKPTPLLQWLQDWNDHLTDFLGFQR
ncbi:cell growth regulator with RING finger domain protein 1-like [Bacillus rossius redtenbacheri]|uniref:cell growth regulator with RING finger domain protein 1-like n=1 Tax=Bacillus rossius redtenbacheri TaxID=93214 RepID=UPI002FDD5EBB